MNSLIRSKTMTSCDFHTWLTSQRLSPVLMRVCATRNLNVNASWHGSLQPSRVKLIKLLLDSEQSSTAAPLCHDLNTLPHLRMLETRAPRSTFLLDICAEWNHMSLPLSAIRSNLTGFQLLFRHTMWNTTREMNSICSTGTQVWIEVLSRAVCSQASAWIQIVKADFKSTW